MKSIQFVSYLHIFTDIADFAVFLDPLNNLFQKEDLKLGEAEKKIELTIQSVELLCESENHGEYFKHFLGSIQDQDNITFHEIELTEL